MKQWKMTRLATTLQLWNFTVMFTNTVNTWSSRRWHGWQLHFSCETLLLCLQIQLIHEAVEEDTAGNYTSAVKLYCEAVEFFIPAIKCKSKKMMYRKNPKNSDIWKNCCNHPKIWMMWFYYRIMCPKGSDGLANSVDPDQIAPSGSVWSWSTLFVQTCPGWIW